MTNGWELTPRAPQRSAKHNATQTVLFGILGFRLSNVHDLLNISSELRVNFMLYLFFGLPYFVLQLHYRYRTCVFSVLSWACSGV